MPSRIHLIAALVTLLVCFRFEPTTTAQEKSSTGDGENSELAELAAKITKSIGKARLGGDPPRILVWPCAEPYGPVSEFANSFSDRLSRSLLLALDREPQFAGRAHVDHSTVGVDQVEFVRNEALAIKFAATKGHNVLAIGACARRKDSVSVRLVVWEVASRHKLGTVKGQIPVTPTVAADLDRFVGSRSAKASSPGTDEVPRAGKQIANVPQCEYCPSPVVEAAKRKFKGIVLLRMIITEDGRALNISVVKSLNPELDQRAIEAVRSWKFTPAHGPNGKPVAVWTNIEVNFREY